MSTDVRFKSKIDTWLVAVMLLSLAAPLVLFFARHRNRMPPDGGVVMLVTTGVIGLLVVWLFRSTEYVVTGTDLVVRSGPVNQRVTLRDIRRIVPTRSMLSAPALSLDRMEVQYGSYGAVVISPADKRGFVSCVKERAPAVDVTAFNAVD